MSVTPDKSALAQARERLERHAMFYGYRVKDGKHVEVRTVDYSDLRLVLDALAEAERVADAGNRHINYSKYLPWSKSGGPNECEHGCAAGIPCRMCDATTLRNWRNSQ